MDYIVSTPCGQVKGVAGKCLNTVAYKGIRYATAGRWEYPTEVTSWEGVYDASQYGVCSYQPRAFYNEEENKKKYFYYNEFRKGETYTYGEDCLFLNVFTPDKIEEGKKLPVIIYIHGGGFTGGCGHEKHLDEPMWPLYDVIGVTLNYRLGPMGFVCLPELKEEAGYTGNYGLFDQMTAISWVRHNIAAFGGDPDCITIMGQSAGAMSVQQHCLSPLTEGMFHRAVMSSGGGVNNVLSAAPAEKRYDYWKKVMEYAGCENLEQFRALAPEKLFAAWDRVKREQHNPGCFPCIDGRLVVDTAANILKAGKQHKIPYMAGITSEDMMPPILFDMSRNWCAAQDVPSYTWYFDRQLPGDKNGAWHSADLWYWLGTYYRCWRPLNLIDLVLARHMLVYLCSFAATGDPNTDKPKHLQSVPTWLPSTKKQKKVMRLGYHIDMYRPGKLRMLKTMLFNKAVGE